MEQDKKCENCKYFSSYYSIINGRLKQIGGYCNNDAVHPKISKIKYSPKLCDKWQSADTRREVWSNDIDYILKDIRKSLNEIKLIMKED